MEKADVLARKLQSSGWTCEKCTFENSSTNDTCGACGASEGGASFIAVAKRKPPAKNITTSAQAVPPLDKVVWVKKPASRGSSANTNTLWIRNVHVPELIGPGGKNQRSLLAATGASTIYAFQEKVDKHGWCPIEIQGSLEVFKKAAELIENRLGHNIAPTQQKSVVSKEGLPAVKVIWILNRHVPALIGPRGEDIKRLKAETGVKSITAWQEKADEDDMCPVHVKGSPECVKKAAAYIERLFDGILKDPTSTTDEPLYAASSASNASGRENMATIQHVQVAITASKVPTLQSTSLCNSAQLVDTSIKENQKPAAASSSISPVDVTMLAAAVPRSSSSDNIIVTSAPKSSQGVTLGQQETQSIHTAEDPLLSFLRLHESCLSCTPIDFFMWLQSVDIVSLVELTDALGDEDFIKMEMKPNGFKYFKRFAITKAIAELEVKKKEVLPPVQPPFELTCPIDHVLMIKDPVVARDGYTYEREAVETWFGRAEVPVRSPMTAEVLSDLDLMPNSHIRTLARDWLCQHPNTDRDVV
jgi:hypothetical protein